MNRALGRSLQNFRSHIGDEDSFRHSGVSSTLIRFTDSSLNFHVKFRAWLLRLSLLRCDMASNQPCRKAAASPCPIRCTALALCRKESMNMRLLRYGIMNSFGKRFLATIVALWDLF